jgi:outer membrane biosynthesis protein TonB
VHAVLLLLAAVLAGRLGDPLSQAREPEEVRYLQIAEPEAPAPSPEPEAPAEPPPPEVAVAPEPQEVTRPDLLAGFQELLPPREVSGIPEPMVGALVDPADFSGRGVVGGVAGGRRPLPGDTAASAGAHAPDAEAPLLPAMLYEQPRILNLSEVAPRMEDLYPPNLRAIGVEGRVTAEFIVDGKGRVESESVKFVESTHVGFEGATRELLQLLRWAPGRHAFGAPVRTLIQMPVDWNIVRKR